MSHRGFPITKQRREERRKQAEARQAEYDTLTLQQKLDKLGATGSAKQRVRLETALNKPVKTEVVSQVSGQEVIKLNNNQKKSKKEEK